MMSTAPTAIAKQPRWVWLVVAVIGLFLLCLLLAPSNSWQQSGSTYNKSPEGYAAWADYMAQRGTPLKISRQPIAALLAAADKAGDRAPKTLLQVQPQLAASGRWASRRQSTKSQLRAIEQSWLAAGNHLIILGISQPVRKVDFSSRVVSPFGGVKVETGRRASEPNGILRDGGGAIVWEVASIVEPSSTKSTKPGRLIYATTPHLGANAYQGEPGNYAFLADLVGQNQTPVIVDEYLHGYREPLATGPKAKGSRRARGPKAKGSRQAQPPGPSDEFEDDSQAQPPGQSVWSYFAQTPLLPIGVQAIVLTLIAIWAKNRRFGRVQSADPAPVDNSTAYIQALAGALRQGNSRSFVIETVNRAELRQLQRQMGLGDTPMTLPELIEAWKAQGRSSEALKSLLRMQSRQDLSDGDLFAWLQSLQQLREDGN
jgi:Domain of unknown function (DUF4350)